MCVGFDDVGGIDVGGVRVVDDVRVVGATIVFFSGSVGVYLVTEVFGIITGTFLSILLLLFVVLSVSFSTLLFLLVSTSIPRSVASKDQRSLFEFSILLYF
jgi:hypothetical protein